MSGRAETRAAQGERLARRFIAALDGDPHAGPFTGGSLETENARLEMSRTGLITVETRDEGHMGGRGEPGPWKITLAGSVEQLKRMLGGEA